jgi:predicted NBD/HSP70 family sugar kinase
MNAAVISLLSSIVGGGLVLAGQFAARQNGAATLAHVAPHCGRRGCVPVAVRGVGVASPAARRLDGRRVRPVE